MNDDSPAWSPNGQRIAFVSERDTDPANGNYASQIYIMNADGSNLEKFGHHSSGAFDPTWSPDGKQIAFRSYYDNTPDIFVINVDGTGLAQLTFEGANYIPDWSR
jgi:Tol biopolymer transport system component